MDPAHLYFSLEGRTGRRDWWVGLFPLLVLAALLPETFRYVLKAVFGGRLPGDQIAVIAYLLTAFIVLHPMLAILIKRLHDLPRSGWWAFYILWPFFFLLALIGMGIPPYLLLLHRIVRFAIEVYLAVALWMIGEMAFRRGQRGDNKYGPDPDRR